MYPIFLARLIFKTIVTMENYDSKFSLNFSSFVKIVYPIFLAKLIFKTIGYIGKLCAGNR